MRVVAGWSSSRCSVRGAYVDYKPICPFCTTELSDATPGVGEPFEPSGRAAPSESQGASASPRQRPCPTHGARPWPDLAPN